MKRIGTTTFQATHTHRVSLVSTPRASVSRRLFGLLGSVQPSLPLITPTSPFLPAYSTPVRLLMDASVSVSGLPVAGLCDVHTCPWPDDRQTAGDASAQSHSSIEPVRFDEWRREDR